MSNYEVKGVTKQISATNRISFSMQDNRRKDIWYALEYTEVRDIPDVEGVVIEQERAQLWEDASKELGERFSATVRNHREQFPQGK